MIRLRLPTPRFRPWLDREVTRPLTEMYSRIDEHLLQDTNDTVLQPAAATRERSATSE